MPSKLPLLFLLSISLALKELHLSYNNTSKTIIFYSSQSKPIELHLSFDTKELLLHQSLKNQSLFLNKNKKYEIKDLGQHAKYQYKVRAGIKLQQEGAMGSIGIGEGGELFNALKRVFNSSGAKLQVKSKEAVINAVAQRCKYPIFLPLMITLSQTNTHSYAINKFSTQFSPGSSLLGVISKTKSPFEATKAQLQQEVTIALRDRVLSLPIQKLMQCGKYSNSDMYECQLQDSKEPDVGGLLFEFNPTFCDVGIELDSTKQSEWQYHYSHLILFVLQFVLLGCLIKQERVVKMVNGVLGLKGE